jgi:hypothetical protein
MHADTWRSLAEMPLELSSDLNQELPGAHHVRVGSRYVRRTGGVRVVQSVPVGSASLHLLPGVVVLNEDIALFEAMLDGWARAAAGPEPAGPGPSRGA